jgi:2-hydroxychromene-2-carboxylate isomerase
MPDVLAFTIYHSPNAYLGMTLAAEALAERPEVRLLRRPIYVPSERGLLIADLTGGKETAAMSSYHREDVRRWAERFGIPLVYPPRGFLEAQRQHWRWNREELPARAYYAAEGSGREAALDRALFRAAWVEGRDVNMPETIRWAAGEAGLDGDRLMELALAEAPGHRARDALAAFERLLCPGVPTFILDGERYFGKDRVDWLAAALDERAGRRHG